MVHFKCMFVETWRQLSLGNTKVSKCLSVMHFCNITDITLIWSFNCSTCYHWQRSNSLQKQVLHLRQHCTICRRDVQIGPTAVVHGISWFFVFKECLLTMIISIHQHHLSFVKTLQKATKYKNSSGDEIANVNFRTTTTYT